MRGKLFFGAATAALLMFAAQASAQQTDPAGDASTTARLNGTVEGEFSPEADKDWYRLRVEVGQRYSFTLEGIPNAEGEAVDPMLGIYDAQGNQLAFNDDSDGALNSALQWSPAESGDVFVEASAFMDTGTGPYRLSVSSQETPPDDASGDAATRARVQPGRTANGNIEYAGDTDWYRLAVRTGQRYRITLAGAEGAGALADPLLRVLDRDGAELTMNDDSDGTLNAALEFVPSESGDVFVEASGYAGNNTGVYVLNVAAERMPTDNTSGDTRTRGRISVGGSVDGDVGYAQDQDWYRIRLQEGQSYRFTLNSAGQSPLGDPLLRLYNSAGEEVAVDDDGGDGLNAYLEYTAPGTGNYFLGAVGFAEGSTGGYTLAARAGDIPSDNTTDASVSADGDYREGVLSPAADRDWYRIDLTEGQGMRVGLTGAGDAPLGDPLLALYGPDGAELLRDDDGGDGLNAWFEYSATRAGPHYIEARGFSEDATGRYAISITAGEIGGSAEMAEYITPNGEARVSTIGAPDDSDWYAIEMIEGRPYRIYVDGADPDPLADPLLTIYDSQGNQVAVDDDGGSGVNSYITFSSAVGGPYFAGVSSYASSGTGRYQLRVVDTDVPGHAYTDEILDQAGDDRVGNIEISGDIDAYRVELEAGVRYVIEVNGHGGDPLGDAFVTIADSEGNRISSDDDSGSGMDARARFTPETSGSYLIQASGLGGSTGWYQVSIMRQ